MKTLAKKLSFQIGISVTVIILLVEAFILVGSYRSKEKELRNMANQISSKIEWPQEVVPLSEAEIDEYLSQFLQNVSGLVLIVVFVTVAGSVIVFNLLAGNKLKRLMDEKSIDTGLGIQNEVTELITRKNEMIAEMRQLSSVGEMAAGICHEIVSPLSIIKAIGTAEVAKSIDPNSQRSLKTILGASDRIEAIVRGMRAMVQGHDSDDLEPAVVIEMFTDAKALARSRTQFQNIPIDVVEVDSNCKIDCRPGQISQIILNLVNNAFDAIGDSENPWVKATITQLNDFVEIAITDSGDGIPKELHSKLFDSFFTTKNHKNGTGLGLSICKRIAEEYGGSLGIDSNCPNTRFVLRLPNQQPKKDSAGSYPVDDSNIQSVSSKAA